MPETSEQQERKNQAHKFFGIELHNSAFDHLDNAAKDPEEGEKALQAAYGSAYHWGKVGEPINFSRGELTIAQIAVAINRPETALHHAKRCLDLTLELNLKDWDLAYAYETYARANACNGKFDEARKYKAMAVAAGKEILEEGDRKQFESDLNGGNWYGI